MLVSGVAVGVCSRCHATISVAKSAESTYWTAWASPRTDLYFRWLNITLFCHSRPHFGFFLLFNLLKWKSSKPFLFGVIAQSFLLQLPLLNRHEVMTQGHGQVRWFDIDWPDFLRHQIGKWPNFKVKFLFSRKILIFTFVMLAFTYPNPSPWPSRPTPSSLGEPGSKLWSKQRLSLEAPSTDARGNNLPY